ncbi:MAG: peptide chain release factor N(5)-glutamine methyltransferase [Endozoicomonas sp.]
MTRRVDALLHDAASILSSQPTGNTARLDAELLLCHVLDKPRSFLFTWPDHELGDAQYDQFRDLLEQRRKGTPVAYLMGERDFWTLKLNVSPAVLIPRPDTELLVELALARELPKNACVVDLGTGTGAIALALASEKPAWTVYAVDKFPDALEVARNNASRNRIDTVQFLQGSWCKPLPEGQLDMIVSNPPYIRSGDVHLDQGDVRFEPRTALASGDDGLDDIRLITSQARAKLKAGGWLLFEHGYDQGEAIRQLMLEAGFSDVSTMPDLACHDRVSLGRKGTG